MPIQVMFAVFRHPKKTVDIMMEAVPRKGDFLNWGYTNPSASSIPVGNYEVVDVCWMLHDTQAVLVLLTPA